MTLVVDRAAVEAEVARRRAIRESGFGRWIAARLVVNLVAFYAVALVVSWLATPSLRDASGWGRTVFLVVPAFMAFFVTAVAERMTFSEAALDTDRVARRMDRELEALTGPRWPLRTLRAALVLAICTGVPLAFVVFVTKQPTVLARASDLAIIVFVSAVLVLSVLLAFLIRAATLHVYRGLVRDQDLT